MTFNNLNVSEKRVKKPNFHLAYYLVNYYSKRIYSGARKLGVYRCISGSHIIMSVEYTHRCWSPRASWNVRPLSPRRDRQRCHMVRFV